MPLIPALTIMKDARRMITKIDLIATALGAALAIPALVLFVTYLLGGL